MSDLTEQLQRTERALAEVTRQLELERTKASSLALELERLRTSRTIRYTSAARRLYGALRVLLYAVRRSEAGLATLPPADQYRLWCAREARGRELRGEGETFAYRPLVSLIMPVYETEPRWLRAAIASVRAQQYERWELCVADDGSQRSDTLAALRDLAQDEPRIRITHLPASQGISAASNEALAAASGDFVAFLDHDDELRPDALLEVIRLLNAQPDLDLIYTDEDKRRFEGPLERPFFKPDWSPDLLLSCNYITHLGVFRRELVDRVGGLRSEFDGSQDYDLLLRVTELTDRVGHVAKPLYTWRAVVGSAAGSSAAKPWAFEAARRALEDAFARRKVKARVERGIFPGRFRVRYALDRGSRASIVVAASAPSSLRRCITSIGMLSTFPNYELLVVSQDELPAEERSWLEAEGAQVRVAQAGSNVASMLNEAADSTEGDALVFVHGDVEVLSPQWLEALLEQGLRREVGAVGLRLLGLNGAVEHEGVVVLPGGVPASVDAGGAFFNVPEVVRNVSAVSGACLLTRRDVFRGLDRFDNAFPMDLHAADYCLRVRQQGLRIVYTPHASLYHHRDHRCRGEDEAERVGFAERWRDYVDPYYNPNLSRVAPYALGRPEPAPGLSS